MNWYTDSTELWTCDKCNNFTIIILLTKKGCILEKEYLFHLCSLSSSLCLSLSLHFSFHSFFIHSHTPTLTLVINSNVVSYVNMKRISMLTTLSINRFGTPIFHIHIHTPTLQQKFKTGCPWELLYSDDLVLRDESVEELKKKFQIQKQRLELTSKEKKVLFGWKEDRILVCFGT